MEQRYCCSFLPSTMGDFGYNMSMGTLHKLDRQDFFGMSIIAYGTKSNPLFPASTIADCFGIASIAQMLATVDDDEKVLRSLNGGIEQWFLTESGLYETIMLSRTPQAKSFKKGIKQLIHDVRTGEGVMQMQQHGYEVLPAILAMLRKHFAVGQRG
jgi:prophage antirepressor-like protein